MFLLAIKQSGPEWAPNRKKSKDVFFQNTYIQPYIVDGLIWFANSKSLM